MRRLGLTRHELEVPHPFAGFLGAGKSTLVRHILTAQHGRRIAVIVNEFGEELGIERAIVSENDVRSLPRDADHHAAHPTKAARIHYKQDMMGAVPRWSI